MPFQSQMLLSLSRHFSSQHFMPELLNNTLETESLEGFMHQLDSKETEEKLSHLFALTVVDMLTLQPDGRTFYSDILWALLLEKCLLFLQQVKLFAGSITKLIVAHRQPLRGCTILNFCLCFNSFFPSELSIHMRLKASPQEEAGIVQQAGCFGVPNPAPGTIHSMRFLAVRRKWDSLFLFLKEIHCWVERHKEGWVLNSFLNHQQLLSVKICWTVSA